MVAIDASSHHGAVTSARAKRIKKHYAAKMRELQYVKQTTHNASSMKYSRYLISINGISMWLHMQVF